MVVFDQLRISDDGQCLHIDAHVNKASYFDNVYLDKVTICTEEQVNETNPESYGNDYVYQQQVSATEEIKQVYDKVQVLSEQKVMDKESSFGGLGIDVESIENADTNYMSFVFSGKYSVLDTGYTPKMVVATAAFNPYEDNLNNQEILFTVDGEAFEGKGHRVWQFKGKGEVKKNTKVYFYIYNQTSNGTYSYVTLDTTDDFNFQHFLWQVYSVMPESNLKEVHLVLSANSLNENFTECDLSKHMFFVYIECTGTPSSDTPCTLDETAVGVTFDYGVIFNQAMGYTRELSDSCNIPSNFIDFILNTDALKISLETEHYIPAINFWKRLLGMKGSVTSTTKPCGCHG